jgi:Methyltransferase domain
VVAAVTAGRRGRGDARAAPDATKRVFAAAYDAAAGGFARSADRLVFAYLARPLARALAGATGPVLDVASGSGALGRLLRGAVALDLSAAQLRHNPLGLRVQADAERLPFADGAFAAAGCAFGVNHFPDPAAGVAEMARVAPLVGLLTWVRPEEPYAPKRAVMEVVARRAGTERTVAGELVDQLGDRVGSAAAVRALLAGAGLRPEVSELAIELPWPGPAAFVDYRLATIGVAGLVDDPAAVRREAIAAVAALPPEALPWRPRVVLGLGRHPPGRRRG